MPKIKEEKEKITTEQSIKSSDFTLSLQKKVLGKLANKALIKRLLDDNEAKLLDNLNKSVKLFVIEGNLNSWNIGQDSEKAVKNLIKIIIKLSVLVMNNQFTNEEKIIASKLQQTLRSTFMTLVSFHEVDFSYDRKFMIKSFEQHRQTLKQLVGNHLSDKSSERIDNFMDLFTNSNYLDFLYGTLKSSNSKANNDAFELRSEILQGLKCLIETFHL